MGPLLLVQGALADAGRHLAMATGAVAAVPADRRGRVQVMLHVLRLLLARRLVHIPVVVEEAQRLLALTEADTTSLGLGEDLRAAVFISLTFPPPRGISVMVDGFLPGMWEPVWCAKGASTYWQRRLHASETLTMRQLLRHKTASRTYVLYVRLAPFSFLILIGRSATLEAWFLAASPMHHAMSMGSPVTSAEAGLASGRRRDAEQGLRP